jgi:hypothetical protein
MGAAWGGVTGRDYGGLRASRLAPIKIVVRDAAGSAPRGEETSTRGVAIDATSALTKSCSSAGPTITTSRNMGRLFTKLSPMDASTLRRVLVANNSARDDANTAPSTSKGWLLINTTLSTNGWQAATILSSSIRVKPLGWIWSSSLTRASCSASDLALASEAARFASAMRASAAATLETASRDAAFAFATSACADAIAARDFSASALKDSACNSNFAARSFARPDRSSAAAIFISLSPRSIANWRSFSAINSACTLDKLSLALLDRCWNTATNTPKITVAKTALMYQRSQVEDDSSNSWTREVKDFIVGLSIEDRVSFSGLVILLISAGAIIENSRTRR